MVLSTTEGRLSIILESNRAGYLAVMRMPAQRNGLCADAVRGKTGFIELLVSEVESVHAVLLMLDEIMSARFA